MTPIAFTRPIILAGGGALDRESLALAQDTLGAEAPIVAADGAADRLAALGATPRLIVGDLDSIADPASWRAAGVEVRHLAEQDTTDFEKCLYSTAAPAYLGVGFTGRRLDHTLAVLNTLFARRHQRVVLIGEEEIVFHLGAGQRLALTVAAGETVSLFPLAPVRCRPSAGLVWPLDGLTLAPGRQVGTSNRAIGGDLVVEVENDGTIVMLPRGLIGQVMGVPAGTAAQGIDRVAE
ncbi:MAG: thiamine diphosphokinase [Pseudomonadota bacterium]